MILSNNTDCTTHNVRETHSLDTTTILINAHAINNNLMIVLEGSKHLKANY